LATETIMADRADYQLHWPSHSSLLYDCSVRALPIANPPNPYRSTEVEWLGEPPLAQLRVFEETAVRSILSENDSPDLGWRWGLNPYRGCQHACAYCYARPSHQYWGFGAGTDVDRNIIVKTRAPELLAEVFDRASWRGELVLFSGNTDCYQPLEASYRLTRRCLEVCLAYRNPVAIITKSALIRRDLDVLSALARQARLSVSVSIPFARDEDARAIEPGAASATERFKTIGALAAAGVTVGVNFAPVIPGLNDSDVAEILERSAGLGASRASMIPVRISREVLPVFFERLATAFPARVEKVRHAIEEMRGGKLNDARFGARMTGQGARWNATNALFQQLCRKLSLTPREGERVDGAQPTTFRRPTAQRSLFE
jgi:DNA repair photolyase